MSDSEPGYDSDENTAVFGKGSESEQQQQQQPEEVQHPDLSADDFLLKSWKPGTVISQDQQARVRGIAFTNNGDFMATALDDVKKTFVYRVKRNPGMNLATLASGAGGGGGSEGEKNNKSEAVDFELIAQHPESEKHGNSLALAVAFSCDDEFLATATADHELVIYSTKDAKFEEVARAKHHTETLTGIRFHPHHSLEILCSGYDKHVSVWKFTHHGNTGNSFQLTQRMSCEHGSTICDVAYHPLGKTCLIGAYSNDINEFSIDENDAENDSAPHGGKQAKHLRTLCKQLDWTYFVKVSSDGYRVFTGIFSNKVHILDYASGAKIAVFKCKSYGFSMSLSAGDETMMCIGDGGGMIEFVEIPENLKTPPKPESEEEYQKGGTHFETEYETTLTRFCEPHHHPGGGYVLGNACHPSSSFFCVGTDVDGRVKAFLNPSGGKKWHRRLPVLWVAHKGKGYLAESMLSCWNVLVLAALYMPVRHGGTVRSQLPATSSRTAISSASSPSFETQNQTLLTLTYTPINAVTGECNHCGVLVGSEDCPEKCIASGLPHPPAQAK